MVSVLKSGATRDNMNELLKKLEKRKRLKGVDAKKYCGVLKLKEDALELQKSLRDEWE